jgi:tape measure domain-containing protein
MPILSNLIVRIGASTDDFDKKVDRALSKTKRFGADVSAAGQALAVGFSLPLVAAGGAALAAATKMETLNMGLKAVMKDSAATAVEMDKLREVAKLPGLGLQEAVQGSIKLQILGNSADRARQIMMEFGNALAVVGGGREDFNEVIRQLGQMAAAGKVTADNLKPLTERIPQLAAIIKDKFGEEALGKPAETMANLGINSRQFIDVLVSELAKGARAGDTFKNALENLEQAVTDTAAEFGKSLLPVAKRVLDEFITPALGKVKDLGAAFAALPTGAQNVSIALTAIATVAPIVIVAFGTLIEKGAILFGALNKLLPILRGVAGGITLAGTAATAAAAALGYFMKVLIDHRQSTIDTTARSIDELNKRVGAGGPAAFGANTDAVIGYMRVLAPSSEAVKASGDGHAAAAEKVSTHAEKLKKLHVVTAESAVLAKAAADAESERSARVDKAAEIVQRYGTVSVAAAIGVAKLADEQFRLNRALEDAPAISMGIEFKDIPKAPTPSLPGPGSFEEYRRMGRNIGELGMQTKEQYDAMANSARTSSKAQTAALKQVSTVITDLSRGITDIIFKGGKLGDMFRSVAMQAAQSITRLLIEGALTKLSSKLLDVGGLFGKVFGGGTGVVKSATSGVGTAQSVQGVGGATSAASSGISGVIGAVTGIATAVSSIVGNFQMAGMNKSLDLIEKEVRYSQIHLLHMLEKANEFWPYMKGCWESLVRMETRQMAVAGTNVVINISGGGNTQPMLEELTRTLKQLGIVPRNA